MTLREPAVMAALREETSRHPLAEMQIAPETAPLIAGTRDERPARRIQPAINGVERPVQARTVGFPGK